MARHKATITLDRNKVAKAASLIGKTSISDVIDTALDGLIETEELKRDIAAYRSLPLSDEELAVADLPVQLDLGDEGVDYVALYGEEQ